VLSVGGAGTRLATGVRSAVTQGAESQAVSEGWARGGCGRPLSQPSFPYNSGKAASPPAAPSQQHEPFPVTSALPCAAPDCGTAAAGQVAVRDPWHPVPRTDPQRRRDGCLPSAPLRHHHRNGLKPDLSVSAYADLTPPPLETAKARLLSCMQHTLSLGQWVPWGCKGTGSLCPHPPGVTVSPASLGQRDVPCVVLGPQHFAARGPWGEQGTPLSLGQGPQRHGTLSCGDAAAQPRGNMLLLLHKSHLCVPPRWQGPSSGEDDQQRLKRQGQHRDECVLTSGGPWPVLYLFLLLPCPVPGPPDNRPWQGHSPPAPSAWPSEQSSIHRRSRRRLQERVSSLAS